jgi:hypothetical protein
MRSASVEVIVEVIIEVIVVADETAPQRVKKPIREVQQF